MTNFHNNVEVGKKRLYCFIFSYKWKIWKCICAFILKCQYFIKTTSSIVPLRICFYYVASGLNVLATPLVHAHALVCSVFLSCFCVCVCACMFVCFPKPHRVIDVYVNRKVAPSKEMPYGWELHTDERPPQKMALVNS